jgi:CHAT domain-containing protein/Tfp pilus assembly protein PilF
MKQTRAAGLLLAATLTIAAGATPSGQSLDDRRAALIALCETGEQAIASGNAKVALETFTRALPQAEALQDDDLIARTLAGLGWGQWASAQYQPSLESRTRSLDLYRRRKNVAREAYLLRAVGESLYALGRYDESLERYWQGIETSRRAGVKREEGLLLADIGSTYRNLGRLDEANEVLEQSLVVLKTLNVPGDLTQPLVILGIVSRARGEYERAIAYYTEAIATARLAKDRRWQSQIVGNLGNVYLDLGRYDRAAELYRQSLVIAEEIGYTTQVGFNHQNLGNVLNMAGRPAEAAPHFEAALNIFRPANRRAQIATTLINIGVLRLRADRDFPGAKAALEEALAISREIKEEDSEGFALMNLGDTELNDRRYDLALGRYDEALAAIGSSRNPEIEYQILEGRGAALHRLGRLDEAIAALKASAAIVSDLRADVSSDVSKIAFLDTRQHVFLELASTLADAGRPEEALEAAEAVRARALADLMRDRELTTRPEDGPTLAGLRRAIAQNAPEREVAAALERLRAGSRELASLVAAESPRAEEAKAIAARLNGATILEYLVTEESVLAFVVQREAVRMKRLEVGPDLLAGRVRDLLAAIGRPSSRDLSQPDRLTPLTRELHRLVIEPLAEWLPADPDTPLIIVPHGPLMPLSFALLTDDAGTPLVERHTISYAPALSVFRYTAPRVRAREARATALIVADPATPKDAGVERLPASLNEGRAVRQRFAAADAVLLAGAAATEAAVKRAAGSRRVLHLATHGLVSEQRPLASSLLLAEGDGEDGYLRADEVFGLSLNADLVVLSGCSTGLGRLSGEGLLGLTRAFFFAGTASLIVSYWDISDVATVALMDRFYAGLSRGLGKAAALRAAQIETRKQYRHPALWGAFVLQGEI